MEHQLEINYDQNFTKEDFEILENQMKKLLPRTIFRRTYYKKL